VYVEAKWDALLGTGKGAAPDTRDDQVVLRRDSLRADPALAGDRRELVVLGISNTRQDLTVYREAEGLSLRPVRVEWLTWSDLAGRDVHPLSGEFRRYLAWKRGFDRGRATGGLADDAAAAT
jgi:hypothetical protein